VRSFWPVMDPVSVSNSRKRVFFFPIRWKSKKALEHVSPYLSQLDEEKWRLRLTEFWKTSARLPCESDYLVRRIPLELNFCQLDFFGACSYARPSGMFFLPLRGASCTIWPCQWQPLAMLANPDRWRGGDDSRPRLPTSLACFFHRSGERCQRSAGGWWGHYAAPKSWWWGASGLRAFSPRPLPQFSLPFPLRFGRPWTCRFWTRLKLLLPSHYHRWTPSLITFKNCLGAKHRLIHIWASCGAKR